MFNTLLVPFVKLLWLTGTWLIYDPLLYDFCIDYPAFEIDCLLSWGNDEVDLG